MTLTQYMQNQELHFTIAPTFSVRKRSVSVQELQIPWWRDELAACFMLELQHHGKEALHKGFRAMKRVMLARPNDLVVNTPLYGNLLRCKGLSLNDRSTPVYENRNVPVCDFVAQMAEQARHQGRVPKNYKEMRDGLAGNRTSVFRSSPSKR